MELDFEKGPEFDNSLADSLELDGFGDDSGDGLSLREKVNSKMGGGLELLSKKKKDDTQEIDRERIRREEEAKFRQQEQERIRREEQVRLRRQEEERIRQQERDRIRREEEDRLR